MIITTTERIEGREISEYLGIVSAHVIMGTNFARDWMANITDFVGGRSGTFEKGYRKAKQNATEELAGEGDKRGADAIIACTFDFESIQHHKGAMLSVNVTGTAVNLAQPGTRGGVDA